MYINYNVTCIALQTLILLPLNFRSLSLVGIDNSDGIDVNKLSLMANDFKAVNVETCQ